MQRNHFFLKNNGIRYKLSDETVRASTASPFTAVHIPFTRKTVLSDLEEPLGENLLFSIGRNLA